MKTDLYTKTMLTLIALFLAVLAADKVYDVVVPEAQAATTKDYYWTCGNIPDWRRDESKGWVKEWWHSKMVDMAKEEKWEDMVLTASNSVETLSHSASWLYYCGKIKQPPKPASK